jgi:hypothetical protein
MELEHKRREDYLNRLGIYKDVKCGTFIGSQGTNHNFPRLLDSKDTKWDSTFAAADEDGEFDAGKSVDVCEAKGKRSTSYVSNLERKSSGHLTTTGTGPSEPSLKRKVAEEIDQDNDGSMDIKTREDFRVSFLRKLSYEKVWVPPPQRAPKQQTVIIFDWDDTLLCTSFLNQRDGMPLHPTVSSHLRSISNAATKLLELSLRLGHTFIITNAMDGWVEHSASRYVPELLTVLQKVRVISARSQYESLYPGDVSQWKINAFRDVQRQMDSQKVTNLNSLGDSDYEMDATQLMGKSFEQAVVKTFKFRDHPTPDELVKQLELVLRRFEEIVVRAQSLKISLERR